ncbi:MAG: hypothetical protein WAP55_01990 [Minisyncoccia bacterium]
MLQLLSFFKPEDMGSFVFGSVVSSAVWFLFLVVLMFFASAKESGRMLDEIHRRELLKTTAELEEVC